MIIRIHNVKEIIIALIFAMAPFLQHYNLPIIGKNTEYMLVLFIGGAYAVLRLANVSNIEDRFIGKHIIIFMGIYVLLNHLFGDQYIYIPSVTRTANIIAFLVVMVICAVVFTDRKVRDYYYRYVESIALIMALVVLFQVIIYYGLGNSITYDRTFIFPFKDLFNEDAKQSFSTSAMVINGLFRPSAFFIEPAHYAQFCTIGLVCSLVNDEQLMNKRAIIISAGIILTTSGVGILSVALIWGVFLYIHPEGVNRKIITRIIIGTLLLISIMLVLFALSDSFRLAIERVFAGSNGYSSAIVGRSKNAVLIKELSPSELIFGMGYKNKPIYGPLKTQYYMTGIIELVYCQGIVGTAIFVICYIHMMYKAYATKQKLPLFVLIAYLPFLVGSSNIVMLTLIQYLPFLYVPKQKLISATYCSGQRYVYE